MCAKLRSRLNDWKIGALYFIRNALLKKERTPKTGLLRYTGKIINVWFTVAEGF